MQWSRLAREVVVLIQVAVEDPRQLRGFGAVHVAVSLEEDYGHDAAVLRVGKGAEPAEARTGGAAGSRLAKHLFRGKVGAQAARGAVLGRTQHAHADFGNQRRDVQVTLDLGLKAGYIGRRARMLQVVQRSAVGNGSHQRAQLQRSHADAFAERTHLADATLACRKLLAGIHPEMLAFDVPSSQLAQPELMSVVAHLLEAETAAERFEILIVRVRQ